MFKSFTALKLKDAVTRGWLNAEFPEMDDVVADNMATDPHSTEWRKFGFAHPDVFGDEPIWTNGTGATVYCIQQRERVLPGKVINQELARRVHHYEELENRKMGKKEIAQTKDLVIAELLPNAFVKSTNYLVMVTGDLLLIETGSAKIADEIIAFLRNAILSVQEDAYLSLQLLSAANANEWLRLVATDYVEQDCPFTGLDAIVLKGKDDTARLKDVDISSSEVQELIMNGRKVIELAVGWRKDVEKEGDDLHCTITDKLVFKRVKFSDILLKDATDESEIGNPVAQFAGTLTIVASLLRGLVDSTVADLAALDKKEESEDEL